MNKRIKELAEQAGFYTCGDGRIYVPTICEDVTDIQVKFAELIVKECGEWCGHDHEGVVAMFKHFGVKE